VIHRNVGRHAIHCAVHDLVFLTEDQYEDQLTYYGEKWKCPNCGRDAVFDDTVLAAFEEGCAVVGCKKECKNYDDEKFVALCDVHMEERA
jgi:hypothetical protein